MFNKHLSGANMTTFILRLPQVKSRTGIGRTSIYNGVAAGTFPVPVKLGARSVGWLESAINDWIDSRQPAAGTNSSDAKCKGGV